MFRKIKQKYLNWRYGRPEVAPESDVYSFQQVENAYRLGYNDGRVAGLSVAREQAVKSLKGILWEQNQTKK